LGAEVDCCEALNTEMDSDIKSNNKRSIEEVNNESHKRHKSELQLKDSKNSLKLSSYIELKTSKEITDAKSQYNFEKFKLIKYWIQSFLAGIPSIIIGFRDNYGILKSKQRYDTLSIPSLVHHKWDPIACINFTSEILKFLVKEISEEDVSYLLKFNPSSNQVILSKYL